MTVTRGRYAKRAADKRAELEVATDLATYQHRVAKLTAENRELREKLVSQDRAHKTIERRLRAERDEGVGPQVEALTLSLRAAIDERDKARLQSREINKIWERAARAVIRHFKTEHGATGVEAMEAMAALLGHDMQIADPFSGVQRDDLSHEASERLQVVRGTRGHRIKSAYRVEST